MVSQPVLIRDKHRGVRKFFKIFFIVIGIMILFLLFFLAGFLLSNKEVEVSVTDPLGGGIRSNPNRSAAIEQGVMKFNADYIDYILVALGCAHLHKSPLFENPFIELNLDGEVWSSEIIKGQPNTEKGAIDNEDLRVSLSKEEAVEFMLSEDQEAFIKESVANGDTQIEMVASKLELFTKGYLEMYTELTGEEISLDDI